MHPGGAGQLHRTVNILCLVIALQQFQFGSTKGLGTQAESVHTIAGEDLQPFVVEVFRVGLHGPLKLGSQGVPAEHEFTQLLKLCGFQPRWCPATEIERLDFPRLVKPTEFDAQSV